ncbi:hypothetical protein SteCoe_36905 [Stentor coeruleus]|uniref:Uncharacterized protein n=1 Tax=Stentor coeruleus TaxID=5963 RepID=A0A1R2AP70_9CILI|nr:hypothetical protein SteCoe_36905 [Stentor coeruleus]
MGNLCPCRDRKEKEASRYAKTIVDGGIMIYDCFGFECRGDTVAEFAKYCSTFRPTSLRLLKRKRSRHSSVNAIMVNKAIEEIQEIVVEIKYYSKGKFKIKIKPLGEDNDVDKSVSDLEEIKMFSLVEISKITLGEFFNWIDEYNGKFDEILGQENNMGKIIFQYFNEVQHDQSLLSYAIENNEENEIVEIA